MKRGIVFGLATLLTAQWLLRIPRMAGALWQFGFAGLGAEATDWAAHFLSFIRISQAGVVWANAFVLVLTVWVGKEIVWHLRNDSPPR